MKIIADEHIPYIRDYFGGLGELILKPGRAINHDDVNDADMLLVRSVTPVTSALLRDSTVKFVGSVTAGLDHLDTHWLRQAGIAFSGAPGFNAPPVADYVVCVLAALQRKQLFPQMYARAAVIGVGHVGRLVADRLRLLGIDVVLCDPLRKALEPNFPHTPIEEIERVDLVCLHAPLTDSGEFPTHHFINKDFLQRQKSGCVLLNAGRGALIDEADLMACGSHLRWCFDVFAHEPHFDKALLEHAIIASPHIAGYSVQAKMRGTEMIYRAALQNNMLASAERPAVSMPRQQLTFAGSQHHWQDVVMGIFNPIVMTAMMRAVLLPADNMAAMFDEMRLQFNYRHEFAFTDVVSDDLLPEDKRVLTGLGIGPQQGQVSA